LWTPPRPKLKGKLKLERKINTKKLNNAHISTQNQFELSQIKLGEYSDNRFFQKRLTSEIIFIKKTKQ